MCCCGLVLVGVFFLGRVSGFFVVLCVVFFEVVAFAWFFCGFVLSRFFCLVRCLYFGCCMFIVVL